MNFAWEYMGAKETVGGTIIRDHFGAHTPLQGAELLEIGSHGKGKDSEKSSWRCQVRLLEEVQH